MRENLTVRVVNFSFCWTNNNVIKRWRRLPYAFLFFQVYSGAAAVGITAHGITQSFGKCFYYSSTKELVSAGLLIIIVVVAQSAAQTRLKGNLFLLWDPI